MKMDIGKILRVNLTNGEIKFQSTEKYSRWIGGIGVGEKILYDEVKPWMTPFDPGNKVIISTGALSGIPFPGSGRLSAVTKSPLTMGIASSNAGGHFASELRYAGIEHVVVEGTSSKPVYIWISDGSIEIRDALFLNGKSTWETDDLLKEEHGDDIRTLTIGQAGENLVRYACMAVDKHRLFGKNGFGAVMGSKNLKAIAVRGTGEVNIYDTEAYLERLDEMYDRLEKHNGIHEFIKHGALACAKGKYDTGGYSFRHNQNVDITKEMYESISISSSKKYRKFQSSCSGCVIGCYNRYSVPNGNYEGLIVEGVQFNSTFAFGSKLDIPDFEFIMKATALCNSWGLDIDATSEVLGWVIECLEKGILSSEDLDGLNPAFGDQETALELIRKIAFREGIGMILAEGVARASTFFSSESKYYASHIKGSDLYEVMRSTVAYSLGAAVSTRGGSHTLGSPLTESQNIKNRDLAIKKLGVTTFSEPLEYKGKPEMVKYYEILTRMCSCMGMCIFQSDWNEIHLPGHEDFTKLLNAVTGRNITIEEFKDTMLALLNLEKLFNYTHAGFTRADDYPPSRFMKEKVLSGPVKNFVLDIEKWDDMLDVYYEIHGCDKSTGLPTKETLKKLGLDYAINDLDKMANAPGKAFL